MFLDFAELHPDRILHPRGTTPTLRRVAVSMPSEWLGRDIWEYNALRFRGATHDMINLFQMEFTHESGIVAWADDELYDRFSGSAVLKGDQWKIMLGRCIALEPDDVDGSRFLEDLLEDAVVRPINRLWETYRITNTRIWVTQPIRNSAIRRHSESDSSDSETFDEVNDPILHLDDYESSELSDTEPEAMLTTNADLDDTDDEYDPNSSGSESVHVGAEPTGHNQTESDSDISDSDMNLDDHFSGDDINTLRQEMYMYRSWQPNPRSTLSAVEQTTDTDSDEDGDDEIVSLAQG